VPVYLFIMFHNPNTEKESIYSKLRKRFIYIEDLSITEIQGIYDFTDEVILKIRRNVEDEILEISQNGSSGVETSFPEWYEKSMLSDIIKDVPWAIKGIEGARELKDRIKSYIENTDRFTDYQKSQFTFADKVELPANGKVKNYVDNHKEAGIKPANREIAAKLLQIAYKKGLHNGSNTNNADCYKELQEQEDTPSIPTMNKWLNRFRLHF